MARDEQASREYADAKSKYENTPAPNYDAYLEKHLIYSKRFNPKVSSQAMYMLNQFYAGAVKISGSPRVRDTLYRTARMISRLKLKKIVDAVDAREACEFYNAIQLEYNRAVFIPPDPQETAVNECLYTLEIQNDGMKVEGMIAKTCDRVENVQAYIGHNYVYWANRKVREVVSRLLEDTRVEKISNKPIVLRYIQTDKVEKSPKNILNPSDISDISDVSDRPFAYFKNRKSE
jgi:DNA replicative helicase MCM subunit Mcm2 (Cdc46/Mcm family)